MVGCSSYLNREVGPNLQEIPKASLGLCPYSSRLPLRILMWECFSSGQSDPLWNTGDRERASRISCSSLEGIRRAVPVSPNFLACKRKRHLVYIVLQKVLFSLWTTISLACPHLPKSVVGYIEDFQDFSSSERKAQSSRWQELVRLSVVGKESFHVSLQQSIEIIIQ